MVKIKRDINQQYFQIVETSIFSNLYNFHSLEVVDRVRKFQLNNLMVKGLTLILLNFFKFQPTWSCVSLPRPTTSSGWKLLIFLKFEIYPLQILMFEHTFCSQYQWFDLQIKQVKNKNNVSFDAVLIDKR